MGTVAFEDVWRELQAGSAGGQGIVRRRLLPDTGCNLFLAVSKPSNQRMLVMVLHEHASVPANSLPVTRGIKTLLTQDSAPGAETRLEMVLADPRFESIFTALVADIIDAVAPCPSEAKGIASFLGQLGRWRHFLEKVGPEGLSKSAQQGLYGELWFLHNRLLPVAGAQAAVSYWTGPLGSQQDYQLPACAIEVKTTGSKQPQYLTINSERQLDNKGVSALYLFYLSVDAREGGGETLVELVTALRSALNFDPAARDKFDDRIMDAGYLDVHNALYSIIGYTVRDAGAFQVHEGFPRITETDLRTGVGDVHYSIAVSACAPFAVSDDFLNTILPGEINEH